VFVADVVVCVGVGGPRRATAKALRAHLAHLVIHGVLHAQGMTRRSADRADAEPRSGHCRLGSRILMITSAGSRRGSRICAECRCSPPNRAMDMTPRLIVILT